MERLLGNFAWELDGTPSVGSETGPYFAPSNLPLFLICENLRHLRRVYLSADDADFRRPRELKTDDSIPCVKRSIVFIRLKTVKQP